MIGPRPEESIWPRPRWRHWHVNGVAYERKRDAVAANSGGPVVPCDVDHSFTMTLPLRTLKDVLEELL